jgi:hypothetical protein
MYLGNDSTNTGYMWVQRSSGDLICYTVNPGNTNFNGIYEPGVSNVTMTFHAGGTLNLAIEDDGTNKTFGVHDGLGNMSWSFQRGHTQDVTPDHIGLYMYITEGLPVHMTCISWHEF